MIDPPIMGTVRILVRSAQVSLICQFVWALVHLDYLVA